MKYQESDKTEILLLFGKMIGKKYKVYRDIPNGTYISYIFHVVLDTASHQDDKGRV